jgi:imidazolonepropionase-like amidohydrolase
MVYIKAGKVFDGNDFIGSKVIVIQDGVIQDIRDAGVSIPEGAEVIDARGITILPGLIDSHIHFMAPPMPYV